MKPSLPPRRFPGVLHPRRTGITRGARAFRRSALVARIRTFLRIRSALKRRAQIPA
jgi:hypothetical protein